MQKQWSSWNLYKDLGLHEFVTVAPWQIRTQHQNKKKLKDKSVIYPLLISVYTLLQALSNL
jgi:hypothetical protein